jgi:tetratricopeptide (TPR) repeat protein
MTSSPPGTPEPTTPPRRHGRDRSLSAPTPPSYPSADPPVLQNYPSVDSPAPATSPEVKTLSRATAHWQLWLLLVVLLSLAAALLAPTLLGIYLGGQERMDYLHGRAVDHYKQALAYEAEDYTELAIAELQIALKFDPTYQEAADRLHALQAGSGASGTPAPNSSSVADQLFSGAQSAIAKQQWSDAIDYLEEIRRASPDYHASEIKNLLVQAYLNAGKQAVAAGQIQQAQARFEAVVALDPSNAEAKSLRDRAQLYVSAAQATGSNWQSAVLDLQQLYQLDPGFYDVKQQLVNALVQYGDLASRQGAWCVAAREYDQAVNLGAADEAGSKLQQANASCREAVVAPTPTATATPLPGTMRFAAAAGIDRAEACTGTGGVSGTVRDANGNALAGIMIRIYNDVDYNPAPFAADANGRYNIVLGRDAGLFHLVVVGSDGSPVSQVFDLNYPGGAASGCHWTVDWTSNE